MEAGSIETVEVVQEGSRWRHGPPTPDQVADWFRKQPLHEEMAEDYDRYIGGVVIIASTEKVKRTRVRKGDGVPYVSEDEEAVFTPYVRVDTRIAYFRDWVAKHGDWIAKIRPVPAKVIDNSASPYFNAHIADRGFFIHAIRAGEATTFYACCTMEVAIYERESYAAKLKGDAVEPLMQGVATKQVPMTKSYNSRTPWADDNCLMRAETGAVGRALGFMGVLVVGTGVATAEDMQEAGGDPGAASAPPEAQLPPVVDREGQPVVAAPPDAPAPVPAVPADEPTLEATDESLREQALALQAEMSEQHPEAWTAFMGWWRGRNFGALSELSGPALKGAVQKLERDLDAAKNPPQEPEPTRPDPTEVETSG